MKRTFVLLIGPEAALPQDRIRGRLEDVQTGGEVPFSSREELIKILDGMLAPTLVAECTNQWGNC